MENIVKITFLKNYNGFTLIEIIAVLSLMGILTALIINRSSNVDAELIGDTQVLKNHLRYAQIKAMNSDVNWGINFSTNSYTLEDASANAATLPGERPSNATYTSPVDPIMFDRRGRPLDGLTLLTTSAGITISKGGSSAMVTVTPNTGFIP